MLRNTRNVFITPHIHLLRHFNLLHKTPFDVFSFTLKPPNSIASENLFLAIWDTSHLNFLSNLDTKHLMTSPRTLFGQFWHMSTFGNSRAIWVLLPKLGAFRKINFFLMKEQQGFNVSWGFYVGRSLGYIMVPFWGVVSFSTHLWQLKGYSELTDLIKNQSIGVS